MFLHCIVLHIQRWPQCNIRSEWLPHLGQEREKTSSSQTRKGSTSDLQLVLLEVLSLLFNIPSDQEVCGPCKWPQAAHLFIALLFSLVISVRVPHLGDPPPLLQHLDGAQHHPYFQLHPWKQPQIASLLTFRIMPRIPLQFASRRSSVFLYFSRLPLCCCCTEDAQIAPQVVPASGQTCAKAP